MAFTEDDLLALERAIKSGKRRVAYADRVVEFQSIGDMLKARDAIRSELGQLPVRRRRAVRLVQSGRGE